MKRHKHLWMVEDYVDKEGKEKSYWTKVGVAFENRDGSWAIELAAKEHRISRSGLIRISLAATFAVLFNMGDDTRTRTPSDRGFSI